MAASLYTPSDPPVAAVVFVHGSGEEQRIRADKPVVTHLVHGGVAVFSYDNRGVAASQGACCPGDDGEFEDLIADAVAASTTLSRLPAIEGLSVGFYGESQAAWIAPIVSRRAWIDFIVMTSAPPISFGEEILHAQLTADGLDQATIAVQLASTVPSGADPRPEIRRLSIPMLWLFGAVDTVIPVDYSVAELADLRAADGLDVTVAVLAGAGHSLIHHPELFPTVLRWIAARAVQ